MLLMVKSSDSWGATVFQKLSERISLGLKRKERGRRRGVETSANSVSPREAWTRNGRCYGVKKGGQGERPLGGK